MKDVTRDGQIGEFCAEADYLNRTLVISLRLPVFLDGKPIPQHLGTAMIRHYENRERWLTRIAELRKGNPALHNCTL